MRRRQASVGSDLICYWTPEQRSGRQFGRELKIDWRLIRFMVVLLGPHIDRATALLADGEIPTKGRRPGLVTSRTGQRRPLDTHLERSLAPRPRCRMCLVFVRLAILLQCSSDERGHHSYAPLPDEKLNRENMLR